MASKGILRAIKLEGVGYAAANILKQEMLAKGGEAVLTSDIYFGAEKTTDILLLGTLRHYRQLLDKLRIQPLKSLVAIAAEQESTLSRYEGRELTPLTIWASSTSSQTASPAMD